MENTIEHGDAIRVANTAMESPRVPQIEADDASSAALRLKRFSAILFELLGLLAVFRIYNIEGPAFLALSCAAFSGFVIHYWLPFRWKEWFFIAWSIIGAFLLVDPVSASVLIVLVLAIYGIAAAPVTYRVRAITILLLLGALLYGRATLSFHIPAYSWPVIGSVLMFRVFVYLHDIAHRKGRPVFREFLAYFFLLPNYVFLLFPVVDFETMRQSYSSKDMYQTAQTGVRWILRGTTHLLFYKIVYYLNERIPDHPHSFGAVIQLMTYGYLLYTRVSGQFHIAIGMLCLFGYRLPETHRRYLLAHSIEDLWRRINIYWKDFMWKMVYLPTYFKFRRSGDLQARVLATGLVFVTTWALHSYQFFWLERSLRLTWNDTIFWAAMGIAVIAGVLYSSPVSGKRHSVRPSMFRRALGTVRTLAFITVLWSFWTAPSVTDWISMVAWWKWS